MRFEDIKVGKVYKVNYLDPNYPCGCRCHTNANVKHVRACCWDKSFKGNATCILKDEMRQAIWLAFYRSGRKMFLCLYPDCIIKEITEDTTPIELDDGEMLWILRRNKNE